MAVGHQLVSRSTRQLGKGRRRKRQIYPLSSLVYCAHCRELAAKQQNTTLMTRLIGGSKKQKYYVHRAGIQCGRHRHQVPRHILETEFLGLIRQLSVDTELMDSLLTLAAETHPSTTDEADVETRCAAAIAKCRRKLEAAKNLYADGEITREE